MYASSGAVASIVMLLSYLYVGGGTSSQTPSSYNMKKLSAIVYERSGKKYGLIDVWLCFQSFIMFYCVCGAMYYVYL